jgi:hypothetical protein
MAESKQDVELGQLIKRLADWKIPDMALDRVHDAARASLNEVKALTEYEDGKISRLLTVITFLSAVVAAVFSRFAGDYVVPTILQPQWTAAWLLPLATYLSFWVYVVLVTFSVWRVIGAIRPRFNVPGTWKDAKGKGDPTSMIFYKGILDVGPLQWGRVFEDQGAGKGLALKARFAKNYIVEAYLVAKKVATKLEALELGISALRGALVALLVFFLAYAATSIVLDPTRTPPAPLATVTK